MKGTVTRNLAPYQKNLRKVIAETLLTSAGAGFCIAIMTLFYSSIGMNQTDIGFTQMAFTIILCLLDIPMGYLADRFNRRILNIIGDIGVALTFVIYSLAQDMYWCILSESLLAIFMAMTNGVDQSFIKYNCYQIDPSGMYFKKLNVKVQTGRYLFLLLITALGGIVAKYSMRLCIAMSFVPYFIGGIIACGIKDHGSKIASKHKNLFKDMLDALKGIISEKTTRNFLYANILANEITHAQVWVLSPMLILCGVPIEIVSLGWIANYLMQTLGGKLSERFVKLDVSKQFIIPIIIEIAWMLVLIFKTNIFTVWLFALNGFVHGLVSANMMTALQESVGDEVQTSIVSIASTGKRLLYIPLVYFVNYLGNIELQYALVGVCIVFAPLCSILYFKLKKGEG